MYRCRVSGPILGNGTLCGDQQNRDPQGFHGDLISRQFFPAGF
jgi:hypothetical protein